MRGPLDYDAPCDYAVVVPTDTLDEVERCECVDLLVIDGHYICRECGTAYGVVHGFSRVVTFHRRQRRA